MPAGVGRYAAFEPGDCPLGPVVAEGECPADDIRGGHGVIEVTELRLFQPDEVLSERMRLRHRGRSLLIGDALTIIALARRRPF